MGSFNYHEPCPNCPSSDAMARYEDGTGYCWSCETYIPTGGEKVLKRMKSLPKLFEGEAVAIRKRGLDVETCQKYKYLVGEDERGRPVQIATYCDKVGRPVAQKIRYADKKFRWTGEPQRALLFGQQLWAEGGRRMVVTEGELDALSVAQVQGLKWPAISVPNGAGGARKDLVKHLEYLESFEEVVLMFDQDDAGQAAAAECAEMFTPGKCKIATLPLKDANEMLLARRFKEIVSATWQAKMFRPDGLVLGIDLWDTVSTEPEFGLTYPWPCLNIMTYGMRRREIVTWSGGTGIGKSSLVREVAHHLALEHKERVGIIALEESVKSAALSQMSISANLPLHLPPVRADIGTAELRNSFDATMGTGRYVFHDHFGSVDAAALLPKIRYMVLGLGVRWVVLDHISIMVSGMATEGDERKRIDELMTKLRSLVEALDIGLHVVTHLRKAGGTPHEEGGKVSINDLRGSGAIGHVSNIAIGAERDQQSDDNRNEMTLRVIKNRFSGNTGIAGKLLWKSETGRLLETHGFCAYSPDGEEPEGYVSLRKEEDF